MSALFIILVGLAMTRFSEKVLISTRCIHGFIFNLIKKSWTDSNTYVLSYELDELVWISVYDKLFLLSYRIGIGEFKNASYFYNSDKGECTAFYYKGTGGNANRFTSQEQCDR